MSIRPVKRITESTPAMEGAGVKLHRGFGFGETSEFDPFLLFDDFRTAGSGRFRDASKPLPVHTEHVGVSDDATPSFIGNRSLVLFDSGDEITVTAGDEGIRFLLISGWPLEEPVAWYGPIVMNTKDELRQAYAELKEGSFIK